LLIVIWGVFEHEVSDVFNGYLPLWNILIRISYDKLFIFGAEVGWVAEK
jgi:hypothetical protein